MGGVSLPPIRSRAGRSMDAGEPTGRPESWCAAGARSGTAGLVRPVGRGARGDELTHPTGVFDQPLPDPFSLVAGVLALAFDGSPLGLPPPLAWLAWALGSLDFAVTAVQ